MSLCPGIVNHRLQICQRGCNPQYATNGLIGIVAPPACLTIEDRHEKGTAYLILTLIKGIGKQALRLFDFTQMGIGGGQNPHLPLGVSRRKRLFSQTGIDGMNGPVILKGLRAIRTKNMEIQNGGVTHQTVAEELGHFGVSG